MLLFLREEAKTERDQEPMQLQILKKARSKASPWSTTRTREDSAPPNRPLLAL